MPPPVPLSPAVRRDLEKRQPGLADQTARTLAEAARPCVQLLTTRVSRRPLRRSLLARCFGAQPAQPTLGVLASKFGGVPYCETPEEWRGRWFLGQFNLADATAVLPEGAPKLKGLLRLDYETRFGDAAWYRGPLNVRARWFADPSEDRAVPVRPESVGAWETRVDFKLAWTLPEGTALAALVPVDDVEIVHPDGARDENTHTILGHRSGWFDEVRGETSVQLLRLSFDIEAGFSWGTNWIYVMVPPGDVERGDLSHLAVIVGNY